jgi:hypothetical protein
MFVRATLLYPVRADALQTKSHPSVPGPLVLSLDALYESPLATLGMRNILSDATQLAMFILFQRNLGSQSRWAPYMNVLPPSYTTTASFTESEIDILPSVCADRARAQLALMRREHKIASALVATNGVAFGSLAWEDFVWAYSTVSSRSVSFPHTPEGGEHVRAHALPCRPHAQ